VKSPSMPSLVKTCIVAVNPPVKSSGWICIPKAETDGLNERTVNRLEMKGYEISASPLAKLPV
jgi:hypothetical protein